MREIERDRERIVQYVNEDVKNEVNRINNGKSTNGRVQDVHTYLEIKGTVED